MVCVRANTDNKAIKERLNKSDSGHTHISARAKRTGKTDMVSHAHTTHSLEHTHSFTFEILLFVSTASSCDGFKQAYV